MIMQSEIYRYAAIFTYEEDGIHIVFPDLPGCISFGKDEDEAVEMAQKALSLHLNGMKEDGRPFPKASRLMDIYSLDPLRSNEAFVLIAALLPSPGKRPVGHLFGGAVSHPLFDAHAPVSHFTA